MELNRIIEISHFKTENAVKNTDIGLFVKDNSLDYIAGVIASNARHKEKDNIVTRKGVLKGLRKNDRYYLQEGNTCLVGYILDEVYVQEAPTSKGKLTKCLDHIVENDPLFIGNSNIIILNDQRFCARFNINNTKYQIETHAFKNFVKRMNESYAMRKNLKESFPSDLRDYMKYLFRLLKSSQLVDRKNKVFQTIKHDFKEADYKTCQGWIFVLEGNNLKTCYEIGKISKRGYSIQ